MSRTGKGGNLELADNIELKNNLMSFRETFREYTDYYTVIGGTACMILMEEASRDLELQRILT